MLKSGLVADVGTISALVTLAGIVGSLGLFWAAHGTPARFLFERPSPFWLAPPTRLRSLRELRRA